MKKILIKLKSIDKLINDCEHHIQTVKELPYYNLFRLDGQREKDLLEAETKLKELLSRKVATLQSLQQAINLELVDVSNYERTITLEKNKITA